MVGVRAFSPTEKTHGLSAFRSIPRHNEKRRPFSERDAASVCAERIRYLRRNGFERIETEKHRIGCDIDTACDHRVRKSAF